MKLGEVAQLITSASASEAFDIGWRCGRQHVVEHPVRKQIVTDRRLPADS